MILPPNPYYRGPVLCDPTHDRPALVSDYRQRTVEQRQHLSRGPALVVVALAIAVGVLLAAG